MAETKAKDYASKTGAAKFFADFFNRLAGKVTVDNTVSFSVIALLVLYAEAILVGVPVGSLIDKAWNKGGEQHILARVFHTKNVSTLFGDYVADGSLDNGAKATDEDVARTRASVAARKNRGARAAEGEA